MNALNAEQPEWECECGVGVGEAAYFHPGLWGNLDSGSWSFGLGGSA